MNKKNWLCALLTVVMVLSMMTCFAMPAAAEGPTAAELEAMPRASEAKKNDSVKYYKIDSVDELIKAASAEFVGTRVSVSQDSLSAAGATNNIHEKFYDDNFDRGDLSTYDTIYITADLDIAAWQAANPDKKFADVYDGFNANVNYYTTPSFVLDGLGHTVKGYEDTEAFIAGNALGKIQNLKMVDCHVDAAPRTAYSPAVLCKGAEIGGVSFENVHLENCSLVAPVSGCGLFIAYPNKVNRDISFLNCSVVNSSVESTATGAFGVGLFLGRWGGSTFSADNCIAVNSTVTIKDPVATTEGDALLFGHINSSQKPAVTIKNVASINNTMIAPTLSAVGIISTIGNASGGKVTVTNNYVAGNMSKTERYGVGVPMENLYVNTNNKVGTTSITACITDANVKMLMSKSGASGTTTANTGAVEGYNGGAAILALNNASASFDWVVDLNGDPIPAQAGQSLPLTVTFGGVPFATDRGGKLVLSDGDLAFLKSTNWVSGNTVYEAGYDWSNARYSAAATYTAKTEAPFYVTFDKPFYEAGDTVTATVGLKANSKLAAVNLILSGGEDTLNLQEGTFEWLADHIMVSEPRPVNGALEIAFSENTGVNVTAATDLFRVQFTTRDVLTRSAGACVSVDVKIAGSDSGSGITNIVNSYQVANVKKFATMAAEDYVTSTDDFVNSLPSVMTAYKDDGVRAYKISTLEELVWAASADRYAGGYYKFAAVSGVIRASSYGNPCFVDSATLDRLNFDTFDTIYLTEDLDIADYPGGASAFAADFDNFNNHASFYATMAVNFDGLGHTITGFNDTNCFAAYWVGEFKNVTFVNPTVTSSLGYDGVVLHGVEEGGVIMENVHVIGGTFNSSAASVGGILAGMASNGNRCLKVYDCSVIDCTINSTYEGAQYMGLVGGLIASPAPGYPSDCTTLDNVLVQGCTINAKNLGNYNSMLIGRADKGNDSTLGSATLGLAFHNVAVFDCHVISETASDVGASFAAIANINRIYANAATDVGSIYVGNVTGKSGSAAAAPLGSLFYDQNGTFAGEATVKDGNYYTDGSITVAVSNKGTFNVPTANQIAGLNLEQAVEMMGTWNLADGAPIPLGKKVTLHRIDPNATTNTYAGTYEFYTDPNTGRLAYQPNGEKIITQQWAIITAGWLPEQGSSEMYVKGELESMVFFEDAEFYELPFASRATRDDNVAVYQINSVAELIKTNMQISARRYHESGLSGDRNYTVWNFLATDTIYITADLNMADWDYTGLATYTEGVGYTPTHLGYVGSNKNDYRSTYSSKSNDTDTYVGYKLNSEGVAFATMQEMAANLYNGMAQGYRSGRNYNVLNCTVDGLNHTIRNYKDTHSFVWGTILGKICNLTFDGAQVDATYTTSGTSSWTSQAIITNGSNTLAITDGAMANAEYCLVMDNVHVLNSRCNSSSNLNFGMFVDWLSNANRTISITNSSIGNSVINCPGTATSTNVGLFCGYLNTTANFENVIAYDSVIATTKEHASTAASSFIAGSFTNENVKTVNYNNVAVIGCTYLSASASGSSSIFGNFDSVAAGTATKPLTFSADNIYAAGNYYGTGTLDTMDTVTLTPMTKMFVARSAVAISNTNLTIGTATADENVTYFVYHKGASDPATESTPVTNTVSGLTAGAITKSMNAAADGSYADWYLVRERYTPVYAINAQKDRVYAYGVHDLNNTLDRAFNGQTVELLVDLTQEEIVVREGVTLELNGRDLIADTLIADGQVLDCTDGTATLNANILFLAENNAQMSLKDEEGYRLFDYYVESAGKKEDLDNYQVKFGYRINFTNADAYTLLVENVEAGQATFSVTLQCEALRSLLTYTFPAEMVERYANYKKNGSDPAFTLLVTGLDSVAENSKVVTVPTLTSETGVAGSGAENYCL